MKGNVIVGQSGGPTEVLQECTVQQKTVERKKYMECFMEFRD